MKSISSEIVRIAKAEVGNAEVNGTNTGPEIDKYFKADDYDPNGSKPGDDGYAWCASFVCWVIREALVSVGAKAKTSGFERPKTPSAWGMEAWSLAQDATTWTRKPHRNDIQAGDIVVFRFSHVGFAISAPDNDGWVTTVEGNTDAAGSREGGGVFIKKRHVSKIRSRIRFRQDKLVAA